MQHCKSVVARAGGVQGDCGGVGPEHRFERIADKRDELRKPRAGNIGGCSVLVALVYWLIWLRLGAARRACVSRPEGGQFSRWDAP